MKKTTKRIVSSLLAASMLFTSVFATPTYAEDVVAYEVGAETYGVGGLFTDAAGTTAWDGSSPLSISAAELIAVGSNPFTAEAYGITWTNLKLDTSNGRIEMYNQADTANYGSGSSITIAPEFNVTMSGTVRNKSINIASTGNDSMTIDGPGSDTAEFSITLLGGNTYTFTNAATSGTGRAQFVGAVTFTKADDVVVPETTTVEATTEATTSAVVDETTEATTAAVVDANSNYTFVPAAGSAYAQNDVVYTDDSVSIVAGQALKHTAMNSVDTVGENTYNGYLATNSVNTQASGDVTGSVRIAYVITATADAEISLDCKVNNGKAAFIATSDDCVLGTSGTFTVVEGIDNVDGADVVYGTIKFNAVAGTTYYFLGKGTNVPVYGINVVASAVETTTETTTVETTTETTTVETTTEATTTTVETTTEATTTTVETTTVEATTVETTQVVEETTTEETTVATASSDYTFIPSAGFAADEVVYTDGNVNIVAGQLLKYTELNGAIDTVGSNTYAAYLATNSVNTQASGDVTGGVRVAYIITANEATEIALDCKVNDGKAAYVATSSDCVLGTSGTFTIVEGIDNTAGTAVAYETIKFTAQPGTTYYFIGKGTNVPVYGINVVASSSEESTETTTDASVFAIGAEVAGQDTDDIEAGKIGSTVNVNFNIANNPGFNNYTFFVTYNPAVVKAKAIAQDSAATYVNVDGEYAYNETVFNSQMTYVPPVEDTDYAGLADGVKSAAELGKIKVAYICEKTDANNNYIEVTGDGTLFTIEFEVIGEGDAEITFAYAGDMFSPAPTSDKVITVVEDANDIKVLASEGTTESTTDSEPTTESTTVATANSDYVFVPSAGYEADAVVYTDGNVNIVAGQLLKYTVFNGTIDTVGTNTYAGSLASNSVNTPASGDITGNVRIAYVITVNEETEIAIDCKVNDGKAAYVATSSDCVLGTSGTFVKVAEVDNTAGTDVAYTTIKFTAQPGTTYYFLGKGTNVPVYGIDVKSSAVVTDQLTIQPVLNPTLDTDTTLIPASYVGGNVTVDLKVSNNPGFNNYTFFIDYDPAVIELVGVDATSDLNAFSKENIEAAIAKTPSAENVDYAGLGADGTKTQAQLGRVKLAWYNDDLTNSTVSGDGSLVKLQFKVIGGGTAVNGVIPTNLKVTFVQEGFRPTLGADTVLDTLSLDSGIVVEVTDDTTTTDTTTETTTETTSETTTETTSETTTETTSETTTETTSETTTETTSDVTTETTTETTSDVTTETTTVTDSTTESTTVTPSTPSRPSGPSGGGGSSLKATTTTEATTEATTDDVEDKPVVDGPSFVIQDKNGNDITIKPPVAIVTEDVEFDDINDRPWATEAIRKLAKLGIVAGIGNNLYGVDLYSRRCDFVIMINNVLGVSGTATQNFKDVYPGKYYYNHVGVSYEIGISSGYGDDNFKPENYCTREEMMVLVAKTFEFLGEEVTTTDLSVLEVYNDYEDISWWSAPYTAYLTAEGMVTGTGVDFEPQSYMTRAQLAVMMCEVYDFVIDLAEAKSLEYAELIEEKVEEATDEDTLVELVEDTAEEIMAEAE